MRVILKLEDLGPGHRISDREKKFVWLSSSNLAGVREALGGAKVKFFWGEVYAETLELEEEAPWQSW